MADTWFDEMRDLCDAQILDRIGETVQYFPAGVDPSVDILAHFKRTYEEALVGIAHIQADRPVIMIRLESLPLSPAKNDKVIARGITYRVTNVQANGQGAAKLFLQVQAP